MYRRCTYSTIIIDSVWLPRSDGGCSCINYNGPNALTHVNYVSTVYSVFHGSPNYHSICSPSSAISSSVVSLGQCELILKRIGERRTHKFRRCHKTDARDGLLERAFIRFVSLHPNRFMRPYRFSVREGGDGGGLVTTSAVAVPDVMRWDMNNDDQNQIDRRSACNHFSAAATPTAILQQNVLLLYGVLRWTTAGSVRWCFFFFILFPYSVGVHVLILLFFCYSSETCV